MSAAALDVEGLRNAIDETAQRGLLSASKWAAELLAGLSSSVRSSNAKPAPKPQPLDPKLPPSLPEARLVATQPDIVSQSQVRREALNHQDSVESWERLELAEALSPSVVVLDVPSSQEEKDAYTLARQLFQAKEFDRVSFTLKDFKSAQSRFLSYYSQFLSAERRALNAFYKLEGTRQQPPVPLNTSLLELLSAVGSSEDPFLLFLKGLLSYRVKRRDEALECLIRSINLYPWNWSAWLQLLACLEDQEEYVGIQKHLPSHVMKRIFEVRFMVELHSPSDAEMKSVHWLLHLFPGSLYLMAQRALVFYHQRDFEAAEEAFDQIRQKDPYRIDDIDIFSNILYVMDKRVKLSKLAHEFLALDKDRPEVCCLVGNHYSLRADREKAVKYFRRAVQLDRTFVSAWTLMGHEFIEMKNSQAAVEAYRRAVDANKKDYRGWYGLGQAYELLNMHNYALYYYQRGAALRPYDVRMWQAMGMCYQDLNRPREAISCFKRALLGTDARETSLNLRIAALHDFLEERAEAAAYHRRCVELCVADRRPVSEFAKSCMYVARFHLFGGGDFKLAREYSERVAGSNSEEAQLAADYLRKLRALGH